MKRYEPIYWLRAKGFKSYLVGNQVRAILLGKEDDPYDIDIATDALVDQVLPVLRKQKIIPAFVDSKFGVVSFFWEGLDYSITTFREEIYSPKELARLKRYPSRIRFVRSVKKDAVRRDITINALYFDPERKRFMDPLSALKDWQQKIIRVIGNPERRFEEDPLRILRVVRFKNGLGFRYQADTLRALKAKGYLTRSLSGSIRSKEITKIKELPRFQEALKELREFAVLKSW